MKNSAYTYGYTGSAQTVEHPCNGYYKVELWGASGEDAVASFGIEKTGGKGSYVSGSVKISTNDALYLYIGNTPLPCFINGAYNGGGKADMAQVSLATPCSSAEGGGSGGGAVDLRTINGDWNSSSSLKSRIMVAGAGGGGGQYDNGSGGAGGGLSGYSGARDPRSTSHVAGGGGQTSGGIKSGCSDSESGTGWCQDPKDGGFGYGGDASIAITRTNTSGYRGGAGGSGWYGGGGGDRGFSFTGAGGSSYISGMSGSIGVTATGAAKCSAGSVSVSCSQSWTGYTFTNTLMIDGAGHKWPEGSSSAETGYTQMPNPSGGYYASGVGHSGNGAARITYLGTSI